MTVSLEQLQSFVDKYWTVEMEEGPGRTGGTNAPDLDVVKALRTAYFKNLDPADLFGLELSVASNHPTMLSVCGLLHDGQRDEVDLSDIISRLWAEYCTRSPRDGEIDEIVAHTLKKKPCEFTLPEDHIILREAFTHGTWVFGTQKELDDYKATLPVVPEVKPMETEKINTDYPLDVWKGTDYEEYALLAKMDTYVPLEFHIETIKTLVGAVAGNRMCIANEGAGRSPRFYTVLMALPGIGKNTAIEEMAMQFFKGNDYAGTTAVDPNALIWPAQTKMEKNSNVHIGVCLTKASSASGFHHFVDGGSPQDKVIFVHPELTELFEKFGIDGSGGALMSAICDLYDGVAFTVPALAKQKPFGGNLLLSLLAGVQPQRWDQICGGRGIEGSGLDERFNLIPTEETRTKAGLGVPDFGKFRERFFDRLHALADVPYYPEATPAAKKYIEEWFQDLRKLRPDEDPDDPISRGRLNLLAWKNALHWAWVAGKEAVDVSAAERGARLGTYQLNVRKRYRPLQGNGVVAKAANAITRFLSRYPKEALVPIRDVRRGVNANRLGPVFSSALAHLMTMHMVDQLEDKSQAGQTKRYLRKKEDE